MIVIDAKDLTAFSRAVQGMEKDARRDLRKRITKTAEPIARQVRLAALGLPLDSGPGTQDKRQRLGKKKLDAGQRMGLRAGLAASVEVRQRYNAKNPGVRIVVSQSMFEKQTGKSRMLPRYIEGLRRKPWRHPVFGNRENWVTQKGKPFLLPTVLPQKDTVRDAILAEYEATFDRLMQRHGIPIR